MEEEREWLERLGYLTTEFERLLPRKDNAASGELLCECNPHARRRLVAPRRDVARGCGRFIEFVPRIIRGKRENSDKRDGEGRERGERGNTIVLRPQQISTQTECSLLM